MKLPPGFPVKVDIPVLPTVSARVTFHDFRWKNLEDGGNEYSKVTEESNGRRGEDNVDSSINGAPSEGSKTNGDTKNKADKPKQDAGSSNKLAKKEKTKSSNKKVEEEGDDDDTQSTVSIESILEDSLFEIPAGYVEDNTRFPDL